MKVVVDGKEYQGFSQVEVSADMTTLSRSFSFTAETNGVGDIPFRKGQRVEISVGDERVFTGWIERINLSISTDGREYVISGRDLLADIIDSNLDGLGDTGLTVRHSCEAAIRYLGLKMKVIDLASTDERPFEKQTDIVAPEPGATAFEWLRDIARRRQVLLTNDGFGNLVITQGIGLRVKAKLVHRLDGKGNNVESINYETDDSQRFGVYTTDSQLNVAAMSRKGTSVDPRRAASTTSAFTDPAIRQSRRRTVAVESSYPASDAATRARWEANLSRAEGNRYTATLFGHRDQASGELWKTNTAPIVEDEFAGISERMLIQAVVYTDVDGGGETTQLGFTEPGAFQAQLATLEGQELAGS